MSARDDLTREGWEKKFNAFGARLKEAVQLYEELGYEVRLEPAEPPEDAPDESCRSCISQFERTIYVRPLDAGTSNNGG